MHACITYVHMCVFVCVCVYVYMYICSVKYVHIYICMYCNRLGPLGLTNNIYLHYRYNNGSSNNYTTQQPEFLRIILYTNKSVLIHSLLQAHSPDANRTQYLTHTALPSYTNTLSQSLLSLVHTPYTLLLAASSPVAHQPKDPPKDSLLHDKLCRLWAQESSLSAGHSLYRRERTPSQSADRSLSRCEMAPLPSACCLAVGWLPHHPAVSPWDGSLIIRSLSRRGKTSSPSAAQSLRLHEETPSLSIHHLAMRQLPAGRPPVGRLSSGRLLPLTAGHWLE